MDTISMGSGYWGPSGTLIFEGLEVCTPYSIITIKGFEIEMSFWVRDAFAVLVHVGIMFNFCVEQFWWMTKSHTRIYIHYVLTLFRKCVDTFSGALCVFIFFVVFFKNVNISLLSHQSLNMMERHGNSLFPRKILTSQVHCKSQSWSHSPN